MTIIEVKVPDIGISSAEITEILVSVGNEVVKEQPIILIEGEKTSVEIPSPCNGIVQDIKVNIGDKIKMGSLIMLFKSKDEDIFSDKDKKSDLFLSQEKSFSNDVFGKNNIFKENDVVTFTKQDDVLCKDEKNYVHASPGIRRLAREFGIDLFKISGSGRKGRILREDLAEYVREKIKLSSISVSSFDLFSRVPKWKKSDFEKFGDVEEINLEKIKRFSGLNLHRNWLTVPHITQFDEVDITELELFRKKQNLENKKKNLDLNITLLIFIIKVVAKSLEKLPRFNSSLSEDNKKLFLKKYINIGIAVDTPRGLLVPVLRDVNKKSVVDLTHDLKNILNKTRNGKLILSDTQGGCFTVSNLGGIGGTAFTTIVNVPEVAILGVSKASMKPIWNGEKFVPRLIMPISLSYDHRVIDGADAARFVNFINLIISDIRYLIM
ncbi:Dihydrolipoyllysine-residue acetyltransferase component of pyruvate dehydrogenase complex [Candidatus Westeberhardia cardiocondylae]|uniref:Dihydrolipoamide acetyltransferase component of pyruvate dehydrogenase complex n=1 Tax=Candidatus Westeberhardia cardiocondylae TaxID=1594731 RepID=A0A0H5BWW7_9ENTR|nr:2-oxo acid dehydrogenase subunit E2 [Candidatus Westeberhardia cardiocondylae]MCR3756254.1 pyruvate dehydrogenase, E2 subunit [Candidatus Westeberhardia cardiocondylae]CEN32094.1 Dihydrolipoyllysine-residue acetyltransferase component of pyruvate dehydrogenase complex [Candidatus Westeberhardia cardiocondylae]